MQLLISTIIFMMPDVNNSQNSIKMKLYRMVLQDLCMKIRVKYMDAYMLYGQVLQFKVSCIDIIWQDTTVNVL